MVNGTLLENLRWEKTAGLARVARQFFSWGDLGGLEFLTGWTRGLGQALRRGLGSVSYEVMEYDSTLELKDPKGEVAIYRKRQKVRFLVDDVVAFRDVFWGEGNLASSYRCRPGKAVDFYREGSKHYVLISLREAKHLGDIVEFNIEREVRGGFVLRDEWREVEINDPTAKLRLVLIFPEARQCIGAWVVEKQGDRATPLDRDHFSHLPDGRQVLCWEKSAPRLHELYRLRWEW
jgi:hypothetical protein